MFLISCGQETVVRADCLFVIFPGILPSGINTLVIPAKKTGITGDYWIISGEKV